MVMWIIIISLIIIGLTLLLVEIIFIPGTTVVGILGLIFSGVGVVIAYKQFGDVVGFYVLLVTLVSVAIALYYSFKSGAWSKFSLKSAIKSRVNEGTIDQLKVGDEGLTVSSLKPSGNAEFNNEIYEVRTFGQYIEPRKKIKIIQIESNQIFVDPVN